MNLDDIEKYIVTGWKDQYWYEECEKTFVTLFGTDRLHLVTQLFAATSINTSLKSNITLFRKALYEIENGLPVGRYLPNIQTQLEHIRNGRELSGRKIRSFAAAMSGDVNAVVVDVWLLRAFKMNRQYFRQKKGAEKGRGNMRESGASDKQYALIEEWVRRKAVTMRIQPRQLSAVIWAGVRITTNGDTQTHYKEILIQKFTNLFNCI